MRATWDRPAIVAVAVGGAAGAALRWAALTTVERSGGIPWTVLALNTVGSLLLGVLLAREWGHPSARLVVHDAGAIGFCGGLTTFSTFTVEVVELVRAGDAALALAYGVGSVVLSLGAVLVGAGLLRRVRALTLPVEEAP